MSEFVKSQRRFGILVACAFLAAVAGCAKGTGATAAQAAAYTVHNLVSDGAITADHTDPNLKNPWGIVFNPTGPVWVANNGTSTSTLYDGTGLLFPLIVLIPTGQSGSASPTGIVYNGSSDFVVSTGPLSGAASFIYSSEGGTISGWSTSANPLEAVIAYDDGAGGAVYKGLAIATNGGANFLYATDFHNNKIDVFDKTFAKITPTGSFKDPAIPTDFAPFGIQAIGEDLYVTYAQQKPPDNHDEIDGAGLGFVDRYSPDGELIQSVVVGGALNAPWGIAMAPNDFGAFSNALLIGNFGDGTINGYDPGTGAYLGALSQADGTPISIPGLWGIDFGNGVDSQPTNSLFFAAGTNDEADGVYGRIDTPTPDAAPMGLP